MIVHEQAREHGTPRRTAHGRGHERIGEKGAALFEDGARFRHEVERSQFDVLVVGYHQDDVWLLLVVVVVFVAGRWGGGGGGSGNPRVLVA